MSIKTIKEQITRLQARLWRQRQYLAATQRQLALSQAVSPVASHRQHQQRRALQTAIARDSRELAALSLALQAAIDAQPSPPIQEILTRRYINDQPFTAIAAAMGYDLRWIYRLHARGLAASNKPG